MMVQTSAKTNPKFPVENYQTVDQQPGSEIERKNLEEKIAYQALILDHIQDAVITFDKDLSITSWNRGAEKLYGYPAEEALGQFIFDLLRTELTVDEVKNAIGTLAEAGQFSAEFVQYTKNGDRIYIEANTISMQDHTGQVVGYITDNRDITARKKVEQEREQLLLDLERERHLWHTTVDNLLDPVTVCDAGGRATFMNKAYERLLQMEIRQGLDMEQHSNYYHIYHPDGTPFESHDLPLQKAALENAEVRNIEIIQCSAAGQEYYLTWNAAPLHDPSGSVIGAVAVGHDITAQRVAEAAQARLFRENQKQKEMLENIFAIGPFGIAVLSGSNFVFRMVNPTYRAMTPHPEINPVGKPVEEVWKPEEGFNVLPLLSNAFHNNESVRNMRVERLFPDGSRRVYSFDLQPLHYTEEKSLLAVIWDITEIELARKASEEGRRILEALLDYIPEGITIADAPDIYVRKISNYGCELVGLTPEEIVGRPRSEWWKLYDPSGETLAPVEKMPLSRAVWNGEVITDEEWLLENSSRERIPILCNAGPIRDRNGEVIGGILAWRDITERKRAEASLKESDERYRILLRAISTSVWRMTPDRKIIVDVSSSHFDQYPVPEALSDFSLANFHPDDRDPVVKTLQKAIETRDLFEIEHRHLGKDGRYRWLHTRAIPHLNAAGEVIEWIGISSDIDARKEAELVLQEYSGKLKEYSEQLEERVRERTEELVNLQRRLVDSVETERLWVSQELHDGPMQEIYALIYELSFLKDAPSNSDWQAEINSIQDKLKNINEELRTVARELRPTSLTPFGLEKAIREHGERFDQEHPEFQITLNLMEDRTLLPEHVRLSLFRIYQTALANVIRHAQANNIHVNFSFDEQQVNLEIQDDGKGFEAPRRLRTFARQGHFGLAGAVERAEAIGGKLELESAPGKGTRLLVTVPMIKEGS